MSKAKPPNYRLASLNKQELKCSDCVHNKNLTRQEETPRCTMADDRIVGRMMTCDYASPFREHKKERSLQ